MSLVWDAVLETHTQKLVLLALADNSNDQGLCWPSIATIARKCQLTERSVYRHINRLKHLGRLTIKSGGGKKSNRYVLKFTPDRLSPLTQCHPLLTACQGTPDRLSPEPSWNRQEPSKGKAPKKYVGELNVQIKTATEEIQRLKDFGTTEDRPRISELVKKRKLWRAELLSL